MKITTIKLSTETKDRLEKLRSYKRESYEEILQRLLEMLNMCRVNPMRARARLIALDKSHKIEARKSEKKYNNKQKQN